LPAVVEAEGATKCYSKIAGKSLARWIREDSDWLVEAARPADRCLDGLTCTDPVVYCDERYAP